MDSKATEYTLEMDKKWPFHMTIRDGDVKIAEIGRVAYASSNRNLEDLRAAKGFDVDDQEQIRTDIARQEAALQLLVAAGNSYAKHFTNPVEAAEEDRLGKALGVLERIREMVFEDGSQPLSNVRALLAKETT